MSRQITATFKWNNIIFAAFITIAYTLWSIWQEKSIFLVEMRESYFTGYLITRVIFVILLFLFCLWIISSVESRTIRVNKDAMIGLLVFVCVLVLWKFFGDYPYVGDEYNIYHAVIGYDFGTYFTYMTGLFYGLCLMLIPEAWSIAVLKILFSVSCMYYCIKRLNGIYKTKWFLLLYAYFFVPAVAGGITVKIHRLPIYIFVYLALMTKLYCDHADKERLNCHSAVGICVIAAVLTQWRVEGIYLLFLVPILCVLTYRLNRKNAICFAALSLAIQMLVAVPMKIVGQQHSVYRQLAPACEYTVDNMSYEGWNAEKIAGELAVLQEYIDFSELTKYQNTMQDRIYGDVADMFVDNNFKIWLRDFDSEEKMKQFDNAVFSIIRKHPLLFIKTRIKSADWVSKWYFCNEGNIFIKLAFGVTSNVFLPIFLLVIFLFTCLYDRKWLLFWISAGGLCNAFLTFVLAPAAYFKYYIVPYTLGYGMVAILIIKGIVSLINRPRKNQRVRNRHVSKDKEEYNI